jgi:hypothetical protein
MVQQEITSPLTSHQEDDEQRRQLRLYFFIVLSLWTFAAIAAPVIVFCLTRSSFSFSLFTMLAPPIYLWCRFAKYLLMDEMIFELEKIKIQNTSQLH